MAAKVNREPTDLRPSRVRARRDEMVFEQGIGTGEIASGPIPQEIKRAVVIDKARGLTSRIIAAKYAIGHGSVSKIWREFTELVGTKISDEDDPIRFRSKVRKKAVDAIESGLDCDRDPYRRAGVGIKVMEGIGEFKGEKQQGDVNFNMFVAGVPAEWRDRYIGIEEAAMPEAIGVEGVEEIKATEVPALPLPEREEEQ